MSKYIAVIVAVALLFCFSGKAYCFSMNDLKNAATQAATAAAQQAASAAANKASKGTSSTTTTTCTTTTNDNTNANVQSQEPAVASKEDAELKAFWQKEQPILDQKIKQGKILKIKDLYLGMNIDNAYKILSANLGEGANGVQKFDGPPSIIWNTYAGSIPIVLADEKNRVTKIILPKTVVDTLFKTEGLPAEEFAKKFVESYHIPKMEPFSEMMGNKLVTGWRFISPEGFRLIISVDKSVLLDEMAKPAEMKFD